MRKLIEGRPLAVCALGVLVGAVSRHEEGYVISGVLALLFLVSRFPILSKFLFAVSVVAIATLVAPLPSDQVENSVPFEGDVRVLSVPVEYDSVRVATVEWEDARFRMTWQDQEFSIGDVVAVKGVLRPLGESAIRRAELQSLSGRIKAADAQILSHGPAIWRWGLGWRRAFRELTVRALPPKEASIVQGICFNMDQGLDDDLRGDLQRTGTIHILSASGLHIAVFAAALHALLGIAPIPRLARIAVVLGVLGIYAAGAGFEPPIVRSVIMAAILLPAYAFRRQADGLSALSAAFIIEYFRQPACVGDIGVQLSYVTTLGLLLFPPKIDVERPADAFRGLKAALHVSLVAWIAATPLVAYHFGLVSLVSVPMNLIVGIFATPILAIGLAASVIAPFFPALAGTFLMPLAGFLGGGLAQTVDWGANLPFTAVDLPSFPWQFAAIAYGLLLALWRRNEAGT